MVVKLLQRGVMSRVTQQKLIDQAIASIESEQTGR